MLQQAVASGMLTPCLRLRQAVLRSYASLERPGLVSASHHLMAFAAETVGSGGVDRREEATDEPHATVRLALLACLPDGLPRMLDTLLVAEQGSSSNDSSSSSGSSGDSSNAALTESPRLPACVPVAVLREVLWRSKQRRRVPDILAVLHILRTR